MAGQWLPVPDWENLYEVSSEGRVRSLDRIDRLGRNFRGRILKPGRDKDGRLHVNLMGDGRSVHRRVSVLVAAAFIGPRPPGLEVCHNDGDPGNNCLSNLRYDDRLGNMRDMRIHGTHNERNKTHCPQGHEYNDENTIYFGTDGYRRCRICTKERARRKLPGTRHPNLTEAKVREIRICAAAGEKRKELASKFGVSYDQIYRIVSFRSWPDVA